MESSAEVLTIGSPDSLPIVGTSTDNFKRLSVLIYKKYMITQTINRIAVLAIVVGMIFLMIIWQTPQKAEGSAPAGFVATMSTTSAEVLPSQVATTAIATSTSCAARVISTTNTQIMLTFNDYNNTAPTATFGYMQPASTTVVYDGGQYGCGRVKVFSVGGATNITVGESF